MKNLKDIISCLSRSDLQLLRKLYGVKANKEHSRKMELLALILKRENLTDQRASELMYGKAKHSSYYNIKKRLKEDIIHIAFLQSEEKMYKSPLLQMKMKCRKLIIAGEWYVNRGAKAAGKELLDKALKIANAYEFYPEAISINATLSVSMAFQEGRVDPFLERTALLEQDINQLSKLQKNKKQYYKIAFLGNFKTNLDLENDEAIQNSLKVLEKMRLDKEFEQTPAMMYWCFTSLMHYYSLTQKFDKALFYAKQALEIIKKPSVFIQRRYVNLLLTIGELCISLNSLESAKFTIKKCENELLKGSNSEYHYLKISAYIFYMDHQLKEAEGILKDLLIHQRGKVISNRSNIYFMLAHTLYAQDKQEKALDFLQKAAQLDKDKSGWLFGIRLLEIMIYFDLGEFDVLAYKIDNFNHLLFRQKKNANIERIQCILRMFKSVLRYNGDLELVRQSHGEDLERLSKGENTYFWDPFGYEMWRFDDWLDKKKSLKSV